MDSVRIDAPLPGSTPGPGTHRWVVALVALGALVVEFLGVLAVQEVWEPELHLRLWVMSPGTFPPPIQLDEVLDSSLFATGPNWLFSQPRHAQELLLGGENCPAGDHRKSLTQSA